LVEDSAFAGNLARVGGAVATHGDTRLRLERVVFTDNTAILGGAIAIGGATDAELEGVRFERSQARRDGRHLYIHTTPTGVPRVSIGGSLLLRGDDDLRGLAIVGQPEPAVYLERSAVDRGRGPWRCAV
jgi:predicted outer membrane repeat protein